MKKYLIFGFLGALLACYVNHSDAQGITAYGNSALANNTGPYNSAFGYFSMYSNTTGSRNTAHGFRTLNSNISGSYNTAVGKQAMYSNTTASYNTAVGYEALYYNTTGNTNTALGYSVLVSNTYGYSNTATGGYSLYANTSGFNNTANGIYSMYSNTTGSYNIAVGRNALFFNTQGNYNTANGNASLYNNTTGSSNTASGSTSLNKNTTGASNTADGNGALGNNTTGNNNTATGTLALTTNTKGSYNTAIGYFANVSTGNLTNATAIGNGATVDASNKVRIGNTAVTSIGGQVGWTTFSDGRFKKNIKEDVPGLAFISRLRPVTYTVDINALNKATGVSDESYAEDMTAKTNTAKEKHTGFIAQEVEKAANELNYDFGGVDKPKNDKDLYGLRYSEFVVPLVKAVHELSQQNQDLQKQIDELKAMIVSNKSVENRRIIISSASLDQNVPNPFNHTTTISYTLPQNYSSAKIIVVDKTGKVLREINISTSKGSVSINAATLASGAYKYSLYVDGKLIDTKQMVLQK